MNEATAMTNMIGIIVAYVPEGLPISVTVGLTLIAKRLCKKYNVMVTRLGTVETLGCVSVIASDKTGTLTQNKMTVTDIVIGGVAKNMMEPTSKDIVSLGVELMVRSGVLCNAAHIVDIATNQIAGGNGVDIALLRWAIKMDFHPTQVLSQFRSLAEIPFSSAAKFAVTIHAHVNGSDAFVTLKGAPEIVIGKCSNILHEDGSVTPLDSAGREAITNTALKMGETGNRLIALARIDLDREKFPTEFDYNTEHPNFPLSGLTLVGLVSVSDPPRPEVRDTILKCQRARMRVMMVTGDHSTTAVAIARQVGIVTYPEVHSIDNFPGSYLGEENAEDGMVQAPHSAGTSILLSSHMEAMSTPLLVSVQKPKPYDFRNDSIPAAMVVTGHDLVTFTEAHWDWALKHEQLVFARTTPDQKLAIVTNCQTRGQTVAVTGDGVNDAPALKKADVGVAMNSGADVARDSADIVLLTDDFTALVVGVREGVSLGPLFFNIVYNYFPFKQKFASIVFMACDDLFPD
jgi:sodium/potassium-transporting ATPase subunit alpha